MTTSMGRLRTAARQWWQPAGFRIAAPQWDPARRRRLETLLEEPSPPPGPVLAPTAPPPVEDHVARRDDTSALDESALATAATTLWRARRRLDRDASGSRETRQLRTLLRSAQEALAEAGVEVQDHDGTVFDSGYSLEVLAFEPDAALDVETVQETLRPSVYLGDRRIQMAQVIVGQPVDGATSGG